MLVTLRLYGIDGEAFDPGSRETPTTLTTIPDAIDTEDYIGGATAPEPVVKPAVPLAIAPTPLPGATFGADYSATLEASGGVPPYVWSLSGAPAWMSVDPTTGAITGTPNTAGTSTFTAQVTDSSSSGAGRDACPVGDRRQRFADGVRRDQHERQRAGIGARGDHLRERERTRAR